MKTFIKIYVETVMDRGWLHSVLNMFGLLFIAVYAESFDVANPGGPPFDILARVSAVTAGLQALNLGIYLVHKK